VFVCRLNVKQLVVEGLIIDSKLESEAPEVLSRVDVAKSNDIVVLSFEELDKFLDLDAVVECTLFDRRSHEDNVVPEPLLVLTESNLLISHLVVDMVAKSLLQMSEHD